MAILFLMLHFHAQLFSFCFFTGEKAMILTSWDDTLVYYFAMHLCCRWTSEWRGFRQHSIFLLLFWNCRIFTLWILQKDFLLWRIPWPRTKSIRKQIFSSFVPLAVPIRPSQCEYRWQAVPQQCHQAGIWVKAWLQETLPACSAAHVSPNLFKHINYS